MAHVARRHRDTTVLWNRAVRRLPGWPSTLLAEPTVDRAKKHLLWDAFTPEFQRDVGRYLQWLGGADFLAEDAPTKGCKESTLKVRREQLRIAASSLVASGVPVHEITCLRCLVEPAKTKALLTHMVSSNAGVKSTYIRGVATTLVTLAKWCKVEAKALDEIKRLRSRLGAVPNGLTDKNRTLLRAFEDERVLKALLGLPSKLAAQARRSRLSPERRVQRMQIALFLDLLLSIPLRLQNLSQLEVGKQLLRPGGPTKPMQLVLNADEVKNDQSMIFNVPDGVQSLLDEYWQHFRPLLEPDNSAFLFITRGGILKSSESLRDGVTKAVKRHIGIHMTPHQFRHLAAKLILDANPGAYLLVQHLLGHKNFKTTVAFYAESQSRNAGRVLDSILTELRTKRGRRLTCNADSRLPFREWPAVDRRAWEAALTAGAVFDDGGVAASWRPATRADAINGYGYWLQFLVDQDPALLQLDPAERATADRLRAYVKALMSRMSAMGAAAALGHLVLALRAIAPGYDCTDLRAIPQRRAAQGAAKGQAR